MLIPGPPLILLFFEIVLPKTIKETQITKMKQSDTRSSIFFCNLNGLRNIKSYSSTLNHLSSVMNGCVLKSEIEISKDLTFTLKPLTTHCKSTKNPVYYEEGKK